MDPAFDELFSSAGVKPDGIESIKFHLIDMPKLEIEVGMTTEATIPLTGRLVSGVLPQSRFISMTYTGPYDGLFDATAMLIGWAKETGVERDVEKTPDGERFACRLEVHENNPSVEPDPFKLVTTILIKVADL
ncbi:effector-binding domain-containing protein [Rhizobium leguminosarum]